MIAAGIRQTNRIMNTKPASGNLLIFEYQSTAACLVINGTLMLGHELINMRPFEVIEREEEEKKTTEFHIDK